MTMGQLSLLKSTAGHRDTSVLYMDSKLAYRYEPACLDTAKLYKSFVWVDFTGIRH